MSACTPRSGLDIITVRKEKHVWLPLCFPISLAGSGSLSVVSHVWPVGQPISPHVANSPNGWEWLAAKGGASAWLQLADHSPVWLFTITWTCWYALVLSGCFHPQEPKRDTNERYFASALACQGRSITLWNSGTPWLNSSFTELADLIKPTSNHWSGPRSLPHVWTVTNQINNESVMTLLILNPQATVARILRDSFFFFLSSSIVFSYIVIQIQ